MKHSSSLSLHLIWAFMAPAVAHAALPGAPGASRVTAQMAIDTTAITLGKPFTVAVTLTTLPDWHIYWSNPGESGIATSFTWTLPRGFTAEALPMPIPSTFVQPGNITIYGYSGATTFLFKITGNQNPPADIAAAVDISWLCCNKDQCIPGTAKLPLPLPLGNGVPAHAELFAAARRALPAAEPPPDIFAFAVPYADGGDEQYTLQMGWVAKPAMVEVYPPNIDGLNLTIASITTSAGQPRQGRLMAATRPLAGESQVHLKAHVLVGQKVSASRIPLLIVYTMPDDPTRKAFTFSLDPAALGIKP